MIDFQVVKVVNEKPLEKLKHDFERNDKISLALSKMFEFRGQKVELF